MQHPRYIIITPVRDEEKYLPVTIDSVRSQTIRPLKWVIVNDGSTDTTGSIIDAAAKQSDWILGVHRHDRGFRQAGTGVIDAFYDGYPTIGAQTWDYLVKLDGDLSFAPNYFERCFEHFQSEPRLGIGGGTVCWFSDGQLVLESPADPAFHVRGATKIYRGTCWNDMGGLIRAPGWDTVDEFKANMLGWRTRTFANVNLVHHRPSGDAYGQWSNWRKNGFANYVAGYHPVFMLAKCVKRAFHRPFFLASAALLTGFCSGYLKRMPQVQEAEVIRYLRQQQLRRLLGRPSIYKSAPPPCVHTGLCSTSMSAVELSIIIVNWYSADYVLNCIRSIREQASVVSYEVIVVDNASFDGCRERLEREHPDVVFVQSQHNLGFARANNLGAGHARGTVLLFLNPDTEVRDRAIQRLYTSIRALPDAGVIGCRLLNTDGSVQTSCVQSLPTVLNQLLDAEVLRRWFPKAGLWGAAALYEGGTEPAEVQAVSGACMMIRRDVFDRIGGFSPDYFMYAEDLDLCFKTRRAGSRNYHLGDLVIVHHGGGSSQQARSDFSNVMVRDSVGRFLRKSRGGFYSGCYRLALTGAALIRLALLMVLFPAWLARRGVRGWGAACRKWFAIFRWGLGLTRWTREYEQLEPMGACPDGGVVKSCAGSAEN